MGVSVRGFLLILICMSGSAVAFAEDAPAVGKFRSCAPDIDVCGGNTECHPVTHCPAPRECQNRAGLSCQSVTLPGFLGLAPKTEVRCSDVNAEVSKCVEEDARAQSQCRSRQQSEILDCQRLKEENHSRCLADASVGQKACQTRAVSEVSGSKSVAAQIQTVLNSAKSVQHEPLRPALRAKFGKIYDKNLLDSMQVVRTRDFSAWYGLFISKASSIDGREIRYLPYASKSGLIGIANSILFLDSNTSRITAAEMIRALELSSRYRAWGIDGFAQVYLYAKSDLDTQLLVAQQKACAKMNCESLVDIHE